MVSLQRRVPKHFFNLIVLLLHQWQHAEWLALHFPMLTEVPPDLALADGLLHLDEACTEVYPEPKHWPIAAAVCLSNGCHVCVLSCNMFGNLGIGCHMGIWPLFRSTPVWHLP